MISTPNIFVFIKQIPYICTINPPHASDSSAICGAFFCLHRNLMKYTKKPATINHQIQVLKDRGLQITDEARAQQHLSNIGYYRLTGYMYHLQPDKGSHRFSEGLTFDDVIGHYQFDKKLRMVVFDYIERLEVALRAKLTDYFNKYTSRLA